jgi:hypothetical protein
MAPTIAWKMTIAWNGGELLSKICVSQSSSVILNY